MVVQSWVHGRHPVISLQRPSHRRGESPPAFPNLLVSRSSVAGWLGQPSLWSTRFPIRKVGITVAAPIAHPSASVLEVLPGHVPGRPQLSFYSSLGSWCGHLAAPASPSSSQVGAFQAPWCPGVMPDNPSPQGRSPFHPSELLPPCLLFAL